MVPANINPLKKLQEFGQSVYLDAFQRAWLTDGTLATFIDRDGLRGVINHHCQLVGIQAVFALHYKIRHQLPQVTGLQTLQSIREFYDGCRGYANADGIGCVCPLPVIGATAATSACRALLGPGAGAVE